MRINAQRCNSYRPVSSQNNVPTQACSKSTPAVFEPWTGKCSFEPMQTKPTSEPAPVSTADKKDDSSWFGNLLGLAAKIGMMFFNPLGPLGGILMNLLGGLFSGKDGGQDGGILGKLFNGIKGLFGGGQDGGILGKLFNGIKGLFGGGQGGGGMLSGLLQGAKNLLGF